MADPDLEHLVDRLDAWSRGLTAREQAALTTLLFRALDPVDRIGYAGPALFDDSERACLAELEEKA